MPNVNEQERCVRGVVEPPREPAAREELVAMLIGAVAILSGIDSPRGAAYRLPLVARIKDALSREPEESIPAVKAAVLPVLDVEERRVHYCEACGREMGVMTRAAYEAAGHECEECEPWSPAPESL